MPINFEDIVHDPVCRGTGWSIVDEDELAAIVAWVAMGHSRHALNIIHEKDSKAPSITSVAAEAIKNLRHKDTDPTRWHRDGWVFQIISWIAMHRKNGVLTKGAYPHMIRAHKGLDGLYLELSDEGDEIRRVLICEEKATENPANILNKVWPEIKAVENGEKDAQITDAISQILERYAVDNIEQMVESVHWSDKKAYRVAITTLPMHENHEDRGKLFEKFSDAAPNYTSDRRMADTFVLHDIRAWMDQFCEKAISFIADRMHHV